MCARFRSEVGFFQPEKKLAAMDALHRVGMSQYAGQRASTLSGGQQQPSTPSKGIAGG